MRSDSQPDAAPVAAAALVPLKITVAPNGARRGAEDHPQLPVTIAQIAETARACQLAGADEIHLHVRDDAGRHSLDAGLYREAIGAVAAAAPGLPVQITTESAGVYDVPAQLACLRALTPAAASISVREVLRTPDLAAPLYGACAEAGTVVQHILYSHDDLARLRGLIDAGTVPDDMRAVLLVLGRYQPPTEGTPDDLAPFLAALGGDFPDWMVCTFGRQEHSVSEAAMRLGGHVRIGFENNIQRPDGSLAADNAENIARTVAAARALGRPLLSEVSHP